MRINAGKWKSRPLVSVDGMDTRPTPDMLKQALFNIIGDKINNAEFCDIFAGTGNVALEALSRGAKHAVMVESAKAALRAIDANIEKLGCRSEVTVMASDALLAVKRMTGRKFDYIFFDPPYNKGFEKSILEGIRDGGLLKQGGRVIVQYEAKNSVLAEVPSEYDILDERRYGRSAFAILGLKE